MYTWCPAPLLYLLAGEILQMIETVNRIAKIAFDRSAEIIGQFDKNLTLRARKTRRSSETEQAASGI